MLLPHDDVRSICYAKMSAWLRTWWCCASGGSCGSDPERAAARGAGGRGSLSETGRVGAAGVTDAGQLPGQRNGGCRLWHPRPAHPPATRPVLRTALEPTPDSLRGEADRRRSHGWLCHPCNARGKPAPVKRVCPPDDPPAVAPGREVGVLRAARTRGQNTARVL